jgi:hypothetical protein
MSNHRRLSEAKEAVSVVSSYKNTSGQTALSLSVSKIDEKPIYPHCIEYVYVKPAGDYATFGRKDNVGMRRVWS